MKILRITLTVLLVVSVFCIGLTDFVYASTENDGYLIISSISKNSLAPLIEFRENRGLTVYFTDVEDIDTEVTPVKIRDYILEHKDEWNLKFLLLVGTQKTVPMLKGNPDPNKFSHDMVSITPTDYFYATPSSNWDKDGDGIFGELEDDGIMAFEPEIFVGRIPFDTQKDVLKIAEQIVEFDSLTDAQKSKCLFPGGLLGFKGQIWEGKSMERGDGGEFSELIFEDHFKQAGFSRYRMYEKDGFLSAPLICEESLTSTNLKRHFSQQFGLVCWTGHGSPVGVVRTVWGASPGGSTAPDKEELSQPKLIHSSDFRQTDVKWGIVLAASCSTSNPKILYNLGASVLRAGCASYIGSTGVAWGPSYWREPKDGGMDTILYLFSKNIVKPGTTTGEALDYALYEFGDKYFWGDVEDPPEASQMNIFNFNLYGDPAVTLIRGDETPRIVVKEPSVFIKAGEKAIWEGEIKGDSEDINRVQIIPAKEDMLWAFPEIQFDFENNKWKIEIDIPNSVRVGRKEWNIYHYIGEERIVKTLVLNIYKKEKAEFSHGIFPKILAPFRTFNIELKVNLSYKTSSFVLKFNPHKLELKTIMFADRRQKGGWSFIDNHFGMAVATFKGQGENDVASLVFTPRNGFDEDVISILDLRVTDKNGESSNSLPRKIHVFVDKDEIIRSRADFNHSGYIDSVDLSMIILRLGTNESDLVNWDSTFDLNRDGLVNLVDYGLAIKLMTPTL